jgi:FkbM family methyltransferase
MFFKVPYSNNKSYIFTAGFYQQKGSIVKAVKMKKITIRKCSFNVSDNNLEFWGKVEMNTWERDTFNIFDRFIGSDTVYFDIGAWIGPTVLYAAQLSKRAYAFEPDPVAFGVLEENLLLNSSQGWSQKIKLYNKAVAIEEGYMNIGSKSSGGDSLSSSLFADKETSWKVETVSVPGIIESNGLRNEKMLFKIDIEGGEYTLIPSLNKTLSDTNSVLFLSFHPGNLFASLVRADSGFVKMLSCWREVILTHCRIIKALPFRFRYLQSGRRLTILNLLYYTVRLRSFSIVAANERWS